jgi:hypothetical protein
MEKGIFKKKQEEQIIKKNNESDIDARKHLSLNQFSQLIL